MAAIEASIADAWDRHAARSPGELVRDLAAAVTADPSLHLWRLVDAALDRLGCHACGTPLGSGERGCAECDVADGFRFAALEVDRPGVPPGNEHAVRVASAVLRAPHRYPPFAVRGNRLYLPLLLDGHMPTRPQQLSLRRALERGPIDERRLEVARTFDDLVALAWASPPA